MDCDRPLLGSDEVNKLNLETLICNMEHYPFWGVTNYITDRGP